jgi:hypothetical protein
VPSLERFGNPDRAGVAVVLVAGVDVLTLVAELKYPACSVLGSIHSSILIVPFSVL